MDRERPSLKENRGKKKKKDGKSSF